MYIVKGEFGIYGSEIYERKKILPSIVIYKVQVRNS